jgi:hypothetical protein
MVVIRRQVFFYLNRRKTAELTGVESLLEHMELVLFGHITLLYIKNLSVEGGDYE